MHEQERERVFSVVFLKIVMNNDYFIFTAATLSILASVGLVAPTNKRQDYM